MSHHDELTLNELVLAGLGARATTSAKKFEALKVEGSRVLKSADVVGEPVADLASTEAPPSGAATRDVNERLPELIEAMMPQSVPTPAMVLQARRNSAARASLIEELGLLTSGQIAEINESTAGNRAALASRWKQEGKIFSVTHHGATYYPAFQFAPAGRPRPVVARVLATLGGDDGWETALWFTAANGYLNGARPVDLLEADPEAVLEAAKKDVEVPF